MSKPTEKSLITDVLYSQKQITGLYNTAAYESATDSLKSTFMNLLKDEHDIQMDIFKEMHKRGWYPTPAAQNTKIEDAKTKFTKVKSEFC